MAFLFVAAACDDGGDDERPPKAPAMDDVVRMNHVQVVGTHNSYHRRLPPKLFELLTSFDAKLADSVDYEHRPLSEQLDTGVRSLELDVFADREGGRYASRAANALAGLPKETGDAELLAPGFKVLHLAEVDFESTCPSLRACLDEIAGWSEAHPRHLPIMVFVEAKDSATPDPLKLGFAVPQPIGPAELEALDGDIVTAFDEDQLLTPDDVRGSAATLREVVTEDGWPTLAEARGRVLFCLLNDDDVRDAYVDGHPSLEGRAMFTLSGVDAPESAIVSRPDPIGQADDIAALATQGFLVRTRADADTVEARTGEVTRRDAALASAANWVSTDFPFADARFGPYAVTPRSRCNPVTAPAACRDDRLE